MRPSILFIALLLVFTSKAQDPDPDIFDQTWYLYTVEDTDTGDIFYVENYEPPISPYVIIDQAYNFNGFGICNSFEGTLEYSATAIAFRVVTTSQTMNNCGFWGNYYEPMTIGPFGNFDPDPTWFTIINPTVTDDPDGYQTLTYLTQPFINYLYRNTPILGVDEFTTPKLVVYPNPVNNVLIIESEKDSIETLLIFDASGKRIHTESTSSLRHEMDISSLNDGIYFLEIKTSQTREVRRILKN